MRDRTAMGQDCAAPAMPARRLMLKRALGLGAATMLPLPVLARGLLPREGGRELSLLNLHTGERLNAEYWLHGRYVPDALRAVAVVLRDHSNNKIHPIDPQLLDLIHSLHTSVGS